MVEVKLLLFMYTKLLIRTCRFSGKDGHTLWISALRMFLNLCVMLLRNQEYMSVFLFSSAVFKALKLGTK